MGITPARACRVPCSPFAYSSSNKTSVFAGIADFPLTPPVATDMCVSWMLHNCSSRHNNRGNKLPRFPGARVAFSIIFVLMTFLVLKYLTEGHRGGISLFFFFSFFWFSSV